MQFQVAIKCMVFETTHSVNYLDVTSLTLPPHPRVSSTVCCKERKQLSCFLYSFIFCSLFILCIHSSKSQKKPNQCFIYKLLSGPSGLSSLPFSQKLKLVCCLCFRWENRQSSGLVSERWEVLQQALEYDKNETKQGNLLESTYETFRL